MHHATDIKGDQHGRGKAPNRFGTGGVISYGGYEVLSSTCNDFDGSKTRDSRMGEARQYYLSQRQDDLPDLCSVKKGMSTEPSYLTEVVLPHILILSWPGPLTTRWKVRTRSSRPDPLDILHVSAGRRDPLCG